MAVKTNKPGGRTGRPSGGNKPKPTNIPSKPNTNIPKTIKK